MGLSALLITKSTFAFSCLLKCFSRRMKPNRVGGRVKSTSITNARYLYVNVHDHFEPADDENKERRVILLSDDSGQGR
jgi:hypothetical protein